MVIYSYIALFLLVIARCLGDEGHEAAHDGQTGEHSRLRDAKHVHDQE